ncbi:MAG: hypothetical protein D6806_02200 [Deltaproteobacteria bacterium]|nr:MAG: hypothetical protein D6806_02200 [Deltaproteobacteria bacterium]
MTPGCVALVTFLWLVLVGPPAGAQSEDYKRSLYYRGISYHNRITKVLDSDLDSDSEPEAVVCYREPGEAVGLSGGILVLENSVDGWRVAWHGYFKGCYPKCISADGNRLKIRLVEASAAGDKEWEKELERGKDFFFRDEPSSPFAKVKISASSTLDAQKSAPAMVFDGKLRTAWAEGAEGTGVGEKIVFEFAKPVDLGLIGMLQGWALSKRTWLDNNRVHRAEITAETVQDRFDTDAEIDLDEDLGLGIYGDMVEIDFGNRPTMKYARLEKKSVVSLEVKIASVLLGERNDDAYIGEVDFAEMYTPDKLRGDAAGGSKPVQRQKPDKSKSNKEPAGDSGEEERDWLE